jgi:hypothetical protein
MKNVTSKQVGMGLLTPAQTIATVLAVLSWAATMSLLWLIGCPWLLMILLLGIFGVVLGGIAFVFIFDSERFDRTVIWGKYFIRALRGKTITHQLTIDTKAVKKIIPINTVHDNGLIEYTKPKHQFGVLFRYDPAENRKESMDKTTERIEKIVHAFSHDMWASFHFSHSKSTSTTIEDNLLAAMNQKDATLPQKEHLFGIYDYITGKTEDRVTTVFLMSIRLGKFKNAAIARRAYQSTMPGLLKLMHEAGVYAKLLITDDEIVGELSQFAVLEEL